MQKPTLLILVFLLMFPAAACADDAPLPWMVQLRSAFVVPRQGAPLTPIGGTIKTNDTFVPELDLTRFVTPQLAASLAVSTTPHHFIGRGTALGTVDIGSAWLLPVTFTVQYHADTGTALSPYIGAGASTTPIYGVEKGIGIHALRFSDTAGPVLQAGVNYAIDTRWTLNADVKKLWMATNAAIDGGAVRAHMPLNPWIAGAGIGYRF